MIRAPRGAEKPRRPWAKPGASYDTSIGWRFTNPAFDPEVTLSMPEAAERVAELWRLTREELDAFALRSHRRAADATRSGRFAPTIVPVPTGAGDASGMATMCVGVAQGTARLVERP